MVIPDYDESNVTDDKASFILQQAKDSLKHTLDSSDSLDRKTYILIPVLLTLITALLSFEFKQLNFSTTIPGEKWPLLLGVATLVIGLFWSFRSITENVKPMNYQSMGKAPALLIKDEFLKCDLKEIVMGEAESYQDRIEQNDAVNEKKAKNIRNSIETALYSVLWAIFVFTVASLMFSGVCHSR